MTDPEAFQIEYALAVQAFDGGAFEKALTHFQRAHRAAPQELQGVYACAALLSILGQPAASHRLLSDAKPLLWNDADGVTNLAVAAETLGHDEEAEAAYMRALELNPDHVRCLNNLAIRASQAGEWAIAVSHMARCIALEPNEPLLWKNQADFLTGAGKDAEALAQLEVACQRFPEATDLAVRRIASLAFNGHLQASNAALDALGPARFSILQQFLQDANAVLPRHLQKQATALPDAFEFFCLRQLDRLNACEWRQQGLLTGKLIEMLEQVKTSSETRDWRDTQYFCLLLPLTEAQQTAVRAVSARSIQAAQTTRPDFAPFVRRLRSVSSRLRIGLAVQTLSDVRFANALVAQLELHDRSRFDFHLYSPTPLSDPAVKERFQGIASSVVDISHLTDAEAVGRVRLDRLDLWMDMALYTGSCKAEIPAWRVAPIQLRQQNWHRVHSPVPCDYAVGDSFTHPTGEDFDRYGPVARFAHTCWLAPQAARALSAAIVQKPVSQPFAFWSHGYAQLIDPFTFSQWMAILRMTPGSQLWLPGYGEQTRGNLHREAASAGVDADRLVFKPHADRAEYLADLRQADVFLDTLRFNANDTLVDALCHGVPAVTMAGHNMASRLGGSILRSAGLLDCVTIDADGYVAQAIALAQDPRRLRALRERLANPPDTTPLFAPQSRVREWEWAWAHMIEHDRAGLPPQAFDIPSLD